ncbi:MAG: TRAFs-binding domain-containing protein, partial [Chitinophagaceae bacterium]
MPFKQEDLEEALEQYNHKAVQLQCDECVKDLYRMPEEKTIPELEKIMKALRQKRMFKAMVIIGDACMRTEKNSFTIQRLFAQGLIERGLFTAALAVLHDLKKDTQASDKEKAEDENAEAYGLIGRVYKQLFVNAASPKQTLSKNFIQHALNSYHEKYKENPQKHLYHGINAVALAVRAANDEINLSDTPDIEITSLDLIRQVELNKAEKIRDGKKSEPWDLAVAVEANVALQRYTEALTWAQEYTQSDGDAFEFASTARQLTEVWQLDKIVDGNAQLILSIVRAALLKKHGGNVI